MKHQKLKKIMLKIFKYVTIRNEISYIKKFNNKYRINNKKMRIMIKKGN